MQATDEEIARFMSFVDKLPCGCWFWTGARSRGGGRRKGLKGRGKWYGTFRFRGKSIRAHRFSSDHIGHHKPLPKGYHRDHTCKFTMCVHPDHLEHITHAKNQERKMAHINSRLSSSLSEGTV